MAKVTPIRMTGQPTVMHSAEDRSVNFVFANGQEARFVQRTDDYAIIYLSSHGGCDQACRFCHLTQTKQTEMVPATLDELIDQARSAMNHYRQMVDDKVIRPVKYFNINWMARGEPLLNEELRVHWNTLLNFLRSYAEARCEVKEVRCNFSTIMPEGSQLDYYLDAHHSSDLYPNIFYSLYSVEKEFRKRWLPKAMDPEAALWRLKRYQDLTGAGIILHWAFIEGENDSEESVSKIVDMLKGVDMKMRFNLVRYNPYSPAQGKEPSEAVLQARFNQIAAVMTVPGSRIVPRVGYDVKASCGMFIPLKEDKNEI